MKNLQNSSSFYQPGLELICTGSARKIAEAAIDTGVAIQAFDIDDHADSCGESEKRAIRILFGFTPYCS